MDGTVTGKCINSSAVENHHLCILKMMMEVLLHMEHFEQPSLAGSTSISQRDHTPAANIFISLDHGTVRSFVYVHHRSYSAN